MIIITFNNEHSFTPLLNCLVIDIEHTSTIQFFLAKNKKYYCQDLQASLIFFPSYLIKFVVFFFLVENLLSFLIAHEHMDFFKKIFGLCKHMDIGQCHHFFDFLVGQNLKLSACILKMVVVGFSGHH